MRNRFWFLAAIYIYVLPLFFMTATTDRLIVALLEISLALGLVRLLHRKVKDSPNVCEKCIAREENSPGIFSFPGYVRWLTPAPFYDILELSKVK